MIVEVQRGGTTQTGSQECSPGNDAKMNPERCQPAEKDIQTGRPTSAKSQSMAENGLL